MAGAWEIRYHNRTVELSLNCPNNLLSAVERLARHSFPKALRQLGDGRGLVLHVSDADLRDFAIAAIREQDSQLSKYGFPTAEVQRALRKFPDRVTAPDVDALEEALVTIRVYVRQAGEQLAPAGMIPISLTEFLGGKHKDGKTRKKVREAFSKWLRRNKSELKPVQPGRKAKKNEKGGSAALFRAEDLEAAWAEYQKAGTRAGQ
ncbi:MAG: hypothetical protein HS116_19035 [Planctomycetes bacterium]|nr:hypothetical protein [Planctomycetota bacterium]